MKRILAVLAALLVFGAVKFPLERSLTQAHRAAFFHGAKLNLTLREQIGQGAFLAALSGFRGVIADFLSLEANTAWENTQWSRVLFLYEQITTLQPRLTLSWEMGAWYMAFDAAQAALDNRKQPRQALREKARREFIQQGRELLERGIRNNPDRYVLYNRLGFLLMHKTEDHLAASQAYAKAAAFPDCMGYEKRFAAYELCKVPGREAEAYALLRKLYQQGERGHASQLSSQIKTLEEKLNIPPEQRVYKPAGKPQ
ncbi:MAG: hypothetical protein WCO68_01895 [Verrucomicrobiota bacterium]